MKEVVYHFEYEGNRIRCIRAVEVKKKETPAEKAAPWCLAAITALAIYGVMSL